MLEFEAEVKSFRVMSTSESPVKVEISGDFILAERANVLSCCTGMVWNKCASAEVTSARHKSGNLHELVWW